MAEVDSGYSDDAWESNELTGDIDDLAGARLLAELDSSPIPGAGPSRSNVQCVERQTLVKCISCARWGHRKLCRLLGAALGVLTVDVDNWQVIAPERCLRGAQRRQIQSAQT